jgi:pSer/pThr/pTyr-binding forkhead associated (FHA) protein
MWILRGSDEAVPFVFRLSPGAIKTIGRVSGADFILDAALVSRLHCRLEAGDGAMVVVDLESTNGTFVNGNRVDRGTVSNGDRLRVGRVELTVERVADTLAAV